MEAAGNTAGAGAREVGGVRVSVEDHVGSAEDFESVGVSGGVPEEAIESGHGVGGRVGLRRGEGADGGQEARVDGAVIEKVSHSYF